MMNKAGLIVITLLTTLFPIGLSQTTKPRVGVFPDTFHEGTEETVELPGCTNLSPQMAGKVKSVNTGGMCAALFSEFNCSGFSIEVMPRSPLHYRLSDWDFEDKTKSIGPCRSGCSEEIAGPHPEDPVTIVLFSETKEKGNQTQLTVTGCTLVPPEFKNNVKSVDTGGYCFEIYNNPNCKRQGEEIDINGPHVTKHFDSIELRIGTPSHDNLLHWSFSNATAVSHCSFQCPKSPSTGTTLFPLSTTPTTSETPTVFSTKVPATSSTPVPPTNKSSWESVSKVTATSQDNVVSKPSFPFLTALLVTLSVTVVASLVVLGVKKWKRHEIPVQMFQLKNDEVRPLDQEL